MEDQRGQTLTPLAKQTRLQDTHSALAHWTITDINQRAQTQASVCMYLLLQMVNVSVDKLTHIN